MHILMLLFTAALSFLITPGIVFTLPKGGSKFTVALTHAIVFAVLYELVEKTVEHVLCRYEPMTDYSPSTFAGQRRDFPDSPFVKNGEVCMHDTCVCNGDQIAFNTRCQ
jgi:hypothetical protein